MLSIMGVDYACYACNTMIVLFWWYDHVSVEWGTHVLCHSVFGDDVSTAIITLGVSISASIEF